jgi:hypothetical protein
VITAVEVGGQPISNSGPTSDRAHYQSTMPKLIIEAGRTEQQYWREPQHRAWSREHGAGNRVTNELLEH